MKSTRLASVIAAGLMSLLTFAQLAEAKVVYTAVNVTLLGDGSMKLDLNHDGINDFTIHASSQLTVCGDRGGLIGSVTITPTAGGGIVVSHLDFAALLPSGTPIDSRASFYKAKTIVAQFFVCEGRTYNASGYLGLEFQINGQIHYGWAQVSVVAQFGTRSGTMHTTLTGFAYETIAGHAIMTGQTSGAAEDDPTVSPQSANPTASRLF